MNPGQIQTDLVGSTIPFRGEKGTVRAVYVGASSPVRGSLEYTLHFIIQLADGELVTVPEWEVTSIGHAPSRADGDHGYGGGRY